MLLNQLLASDWKSIRQVWLVYTLITPPGGSTCRQSAPSIDHNESPAFKILYFAKHNQIHKLTKSRRRKWTNVAINQLQMYRPTMIYDKQLNEFKQMSK